MIFWAIPVSFVGIVSNVSQHCRLPDVVVGIISGILPPVALAILTMLLPIVLRLLARFEGIPRFTGLELSLMSRYFIFQVIHSFLIVTISSGLIAALRQLASNPTSIPTILAEKPPEASTIFLPYAMLQGLAGSAGGVFTDCAVGVVLCEVVYPRKHSWLDIHDQVLSAERGMGYAVPGYDADHGHRTCLLVDFAHHQRAGVRCILPVLSAGDTGGLFFPKAMQHIFVGLYIEQICLCALFFLSRDSQLRASAIPQGALMIVLIVITAGYHFVINDSYNALLHPLPLTLAHKSHGMPREHHPSQDDEAVRDEDELRERDFGRQSSSDSAAHPLTKNGEPLSADQQVKLDKIERERAEHEMHARSAPAKSEKYGKNVAEEGKHNDGPEDFTHPAAIEPQRVVWLPRDPLGVAEAEEHELKSQGIEVSTENAVIDEKGHVELTGPPPGGEKDALFG
ncbi:unnamed protein product [Rhizoctonia solani]|uniref:Uncharacterized protein n=1 Tax=Rhizoctonia solani TaxID=456999 RepID=A0A8H3B2N6_9AGAM|nr:unnamed protein product [Rhizoctonia solani]